MGAVMQRRRFLICLAACPQAGCDSTPPDDPNESTRRRLVGTWLRAYDEHGVRVRRVLVMNDNGTFQEASSMQPADLLVPKSLSNGSGVWLFDGTNLKRHYRLINGKPTAAPIVPFATFEIRFPSRTEFIGIDRVRRREVLYARVPEGTEP